MVTVTCLGGAGSVTGSNYLVQGSKGKKILVDCGLFQGGKKMEQRNWEDWGFNPKEIGTLFLTHAHIDHSGRIPKLVKDGFQGRIVTSPPTAELCEVMLPDSAHIQEMDAEWQTRKNRRQNREEVAPLYTVADAEESLRLLYPMERDQILEVEAGIRARLRNAGHILGSSILELWIEEKDKTIKIVFSGDLGKKNQLIVRDPHEIFDADYLFLESTYGNRLHRTFEDSKAELLEAINYAFFNNEKIIIPAFAVERTQEILYILGEYQREGKIPDIPIFLDSPLAIKATEIFRRNKKYYDEEALAIVEQGYDPFDMPNLKFSSTSQDSMAINKAKGSAIIIAGSGMCTAGRIKHHLKHNLWRLGASIVIVGFQAQGTTGRQIVEGATKVKIFGENVAVKAKVFTIGGFSAHADQNDLLEWVSNFKSTPRIFLIHGEAEGSMVLAQKIEERFKYQTHVPVWKEKLMLTPTGATYEEPVFDLPTEDRSDVMLNSIIDITRELEQLRKRIARRKGAEKVAQQDLERLNALKAEIQRIGA